MKAISHLAVVAIVLAMGIERADEQPDILKQLGLDPATMTPEDFYHVMENFREGRAVYDVPSRRSQQSSADADEIQAAMVRTSRTRPRVNPISPDTNMTPSTTRSTAVIVSPLSVR